MSIKLNSSLKLNREFSNQVSRMSIEMGIDIDLARNIIRHKRNQKPKAKKIWTDPKTGYPLSQKQWTGPAAKRAQQVKEGTSSTRLSPFTDDDFKISQDPDVTHMNATLMGMEKVGTVLWDKHDFAMFESQLQLERKQPYFK